MFYLLLLLLHSQSTAGNEQRAQLQLREDQYTRGVLTGDTRLLEDVWAETFEDTDENGHLSTKKEQLAKVRASTVKLLTLHVDQEKTDFYETMAVVRERFTVTYEDHGNKGTEIGRSTDVWIFQKGKWMCVAAHSSAQTTNKN
jgi:hypothetical protein